VIISAVDARDPELKTVRKVLVSSADGERWRTSLKTWSIHCVFVPPASA